MSGRDEILARVEAALGPTPPEPEAVRRTYRTRGDRSPGDPALLDRLAERLADYRAGVRRTSPADVAAAVAAALADGLARAATLQREPARHARPRIVVPPDLQEAWLATTDVDVVTDDGLSAEDLDAVAGVVTAAALAVAETGTIVLDGSPGQGRRALTLVPDLHVCVVEADQVVEDVPDAVGRLDPTRPLTWISGPSATSDIELERVEGVHGPRTLEVVVVERA